MYQNGNICSTAADVYIIPKHREIVMTSPIMHIAIVVKYFLSFKLWSVDS